MSVPGVVIIGSPEPRESKIEIDPHGELWCRVLVVKIIDSGAMVTKKIGWERQSALVVVDIR